TGGSSGLSPAIRRNVLAGLTYLEQARTVVDVVRDVPLPTFDPMLPSSSPDPEALEAFAERWGLVSSVRRLSTALGWS
ncbi:MAG: flap endonuclease, partial [Actinomycetes bacterium]